MNNHFSLYVAPEDASIYKNILDKPRKDGLQGILRVVPLDKRQIYCVNPNRLPMLSYKNREYYREQAVKRFLFELVEV